MSSCRLITSPITGEEVTSKTWDDIYKLVDKNEELADKFYDQLFEPEFIQYFGNWVEVPGMLKDAKKFAEEIKNPLLKEPFVRDTELALFELAIQANTSDGNENRLEGYPLSLLSIAQNLFPEATIGSEYVPLLSKVVNEHGEPMIVYHSRFSKFQKFDPSRSEEEGFHFGTLKSAAQRHYGWDGEGDISAEQMIADIKEENKKFNVLPVFLNLRNLKKGVDALEASRETSLDEYQQEDLMKRSTRSYDYTTLLMALVDNDSISIEQAQEIADGKMSIQDAMNADGYYYTNVLEDKGSTSYVAFEPSQIKAFNNKGGFNSQNDNIYLSANSVNYGFKAADVLMLNENINKINQWENNKSISHDTLWDKIQKLGIPKTQLELIKSSEGSTVSEKLTSFLANYSHVIEINTAKYNTKGYNIEGVGEMIDIQEGNAQHYSNLTVPGGTNYTENEIATPAITPSIKGHARFSTDNGLMWSRTDEKIQYQEQDIDNLLKIMENSKILQIKCS